MILLDTNVVAEAIRPDPDPAVLAWLDAQVAETLYVSSITVAELLAGVVALPEGGPKDLLAARIERLLDQFAGRILLFDLDAARWHADLTAGAHSDAQGLSPRDLTIAAIAAAHGFEIASRDARAFNAARLKEAGL